MLTIYKFLLIFAAMAIMNVLGKLIFDLEQSSSEALLTLSLAVTYCMEQDKK